MLYSRLPCAVAFCVLAYPLSAQSFWSVDDDGPADFATIQSAIDAASPGDTIEVQSGSYSDFVVDKGLNLIGIGTAQVTTLGGEGFSIENVPFGQTVRLVNVGVTSTHPLAAASIVVRNNVGDVHLSALSQPALGGEFSIENCAYVTVHGMPIRGGVTGVFTITSSTVQISDCEVTGPSSTSAGAPAVSIQSSTVHIGSSTFDGSADPLFGSHFPGIELLSGSLTLGAGVTVLAGAGIGAVPAIATGGGLVELDPHVMLAAVGGAADIEGPATVTTRTVSDCSIVEATAAGGTLTVRTQAPVGASVLTLIAEPGSPLPTVFGDLMLRGQLITLDAGTVSPSGQRTTTLPVSLTTLAGFTLAAQALVLDGGEFHLSVGSTAVFAAP